MASTEALNYNDLCFTERSKIVVQRTKTSTECEHQGNLRLVNQINIAKSKNCLR